MGKITDRIPTSVDSSIRKLGECWTPNITLFHCILRGCDMIECRSNKRRWKSDVFAFECQNLRMDFKVGDTSSPKMSSNSCRYCGANKQNLTQKGQFETARTSLWIMSQFGKCKLIGMQARNSWWAFLCMTALNGLYARKL